MRHIVCLACAPWQSIPTRTQQLMSRMKGMEVLYFEPAGGGSGTVHARQGRRVRPGVTVYTLPAVRHGGARWEWLFRRELRRLGVYVRDILQQRGIREPLLWCTTPENVHLLDEIPCRGLVYDCDRYWSGLPLSWESDLALGAEVVFAASGGLADRLAPCSGNIAVVPNGCNFPMFTRSDIEVPACLKGVGHPLVGYVGTLWRDVDFDPVFTTAAAHPDWRFLLLGRQEPGPGLQRLREMPQVILADRRPLIEVPDFVHQLDVCIDLRRGGVPSDVLPGRVFEYLAAGKPVVRHGFPGQVGDLPGLVYQAEDLHGFAACCEQALREDGAWMAARRREAGEEAGWDRRAEQVRKLLEGNMLL